MLSLLVLGFQGEVNIEYPLGLNGRTRTEVLYYKCETPDLGLTLTLGSLGVIMNGRVSSLGFLGNYWRLGGEVGGGGLLFALHVLTAEIFSVRE